MQEYLRTANGALVPIRDGLQVGRDPAGDVVLDDVSVSRAHLVLRGRPGRWFAEDLGSRNGTRVNTSRLAFGQRHPLRHGDELQLGTVCLWVISQAEADDIDRTNSVVLRRPDWVAGLSAFQFDVVRHLAAPWLAGGEPATNAEIAGSLGTPLAVEAVKAALRRVYAKAGLTDEGGANKRRELCVRAQKQGWI